MSRESEWESERVREWENEGVTFEHRNENKSCSACRERVTEWVRKWVNEWERECSWFPAFAWRSDIYISCDLYATFLYYIAVNPIWRCHIYWVQTCFGRFLLLQLQPFQLTADLVDTKELVKSFGNVCDVLLSTNVTFVTLTLTLFNLGSRIMETFFDISIFKPYKKY